MAETETKQKRRPKLREVPIWQKLLLTVEEASDYSGIGMNRLRTLARRQGCSWVVWNGSKQLIKRHKFEEWLERQDEI